MYQFSQYFEYYNELNIEMEINLTSETVAVTAIELFKHIFES